MTVTTPVPPARAITDLELITTVDLLNTSTVGTDPKQVFHFIYGSHLYGSLFGVYGRFETKPSSTGKRYVETISLRIFTYTGVLNIGFATFDPTYNSTKSEIIFGIKGNSGLEEKILKFDPDELVVTSKVAHRLIFSRIAFPLTGTAVTTKPDDARGTPPQGSVLFDTEFYYRNGIDNFSQFTRDGMSTIDDAKQFLLIPAHRCLTSEVNLYYSE